MKLETLIKHLQKLEKENGGNIKVRVRDYNGSFSNVKTIELSIDGKAVRIDAAQ